MKKILFVLLAVIMILSVVAIPALAGPPQEALGTWNYAPIVETMEYEFVSCNTFISMTDTGIFEGTFDGTEIEVGLAVIYCNGRASYKGILSFTGTVAGSEPGTMELRTVGNSPDYSFWKGTWVILSGTDGLENLRGQGTWSGPPGSFVYEGKIHFEPN
jgi:hypothetical protein